MKLLAEIKVCPSDRHAERRLGKHCEPMNKNLIQGRCDGQDCVLTWGDLTRESG